MLLEKTPYIYFLYAFIFIWVFLGLVWPMAICNIIGDETECFKATHRIDLVWDFFERIVEDFYKMIIFPTFFDVPQKAGEIIFDYLTSLFRFSINSLGLYHPTCTLYYFSLPTYLNATDIPLDGFMDACVGRNGTYGQMTEEEFLSRGSSLQAMTIYQGYLVFIVILTIIMDDCYKIRPLARSPVFQFMVFLLFSYFFYARNMISLCIEFDEIQGFGTCSVLEKP
jgi:hypothetical protein